MITFRSHTLSRNLSTNPGRHESSVEIEEVQTSDSTANDMGWNSGSKNNVDDIVGYNELVPGCGITSTHNNFLTSNLERELLSASKTLCQLSCLYRRTVVSGVMAGHCRDRVLCFGDNHRSKSSIRLAIEDTYLEAHEQWNFVTETAQFSDDISPMDSTPLRIEDNFRRTPFARIYNVRCQYFVQIFVCSGWQSRLGQSHRS
jgi:hypothetical protein